MCFQFSVPFSPPLVLGLENFGLYEDIGAFAFLIEFCQSVCFALPFEGRLVDW